MAPFITGPDTLPLAKFLAPAFDPRDNTQIFQF
jgi:hypothetical protein